MLWLAVHCGIGAVMQLYGLARSLAGRMTAEHDIDVHNVALYWHFVGVTVWVTVPTVSLFPLAV